MITISKRHLSYLCLTCIVAGWWLSLPQTPEPPTQRPVLRWVAKAAKNALWFMLLAEQPPASHESQYAHARIGADGAPLLDHGAGW